MTTTITRAPAVRATPPAPEPTITIEPDGTEPTPRDMDILALKLVGAATVGAGALGAVGGGLSGLVTHRNPVATSLRTGGAMAGLTLLCTAIPAAVYLYAAHNGLGGLSVDIRGTDG